MTTKIKTGGLAGVVAGDSSICLCDPEDENLLYRGYSIEDLADKASFEEVAWLLTRGKLPNKKELDSYKALLKKNFDLPKQVKDILIQLPPSESMMDILRSACSILGNFEPESSQRSQQAIADRLIASFGSMLLYWYWSQRNQEKISLNTDEDSIAGHILHLILRKPPTEEQRRCLDVSMILYAEHEFNASTFTVRTIASTLSDFYSAICGGIGALRGPLHGGANEAAMEMMLKFKNADDAEKAIREKLAKKQLIMGFGHRVYTRSDPRSAIIKKWAHRLVGNNRTFKNLFDIAERIEKILWDEKKLFPNLDFYSALAYHFIGIPIPMFTPLFVMSRVTGWSSHLMEQRANNKLIRPVSHYIGPNIQQWLPINDR